MHFLAVLISRSRSNHLSRRTPFRICSSSVKGPFVLTQYWLGCDYWSDVVCATLPRIPCSDGGCHPRLAPLCLFESSPLIVTATAIRYTVCVCVCVSQTTLDILYVRPFMAFSTGWRISRSQAQLELEQTHLPFAMQCACQNQRRQVFHLIQRLCYSRTPTNWRDLLSSWYYDNMIPPPPSLSRACVLGSAWQQLADQKGSQVPSTCRGCPLPITSRRQARRFLDTEPIYLSMISLILKHNLEYRLYP